MEPHPGVFCSTVRTGEWEPDPEVPGSEMHELVHADGVWAGLTRFTAVEGPTPWTPSQRETIHVLEGEVTIEIAGGPALTLKPGVVGPETPLDPQTPGPGGAAQISKFVRREVARCE